MLQLVAIKGLISYSKEQLGTKMRRTTYTVPEVAKVIEMSTSALYTAIRDGKTPFPVLKIGGRFVVPAKPLCDLLGIDEIPADAA